MQDPELWARLQAHQFDHSEGSAPFSVKLAETHGWSTAHTAKVIDEYRKFLYLTQISPDQATPSAAVDSAWHMHLTFTRDYWHSLCDGVLNAPLHHDPCVGDEAMPTYDRQYAATMALYEQEFGALPPSNIWPTSDAGPAKPGAVWAAVGAAGLLIAGFVVLLGLDHKLGGALLLMAATALGLWAITMLPDQRGKKRGVPGHANAAGCGGSSDGGAGCGGGGCGGGGCGGGGGG